MRYCFGDYTLDTERYELRYQAISVPVQPRVLDLLRYLVEQRERTIGKSELIERVWNGQLVSEATLASCVGQARRSIGDDGRSQRTIQTIHGRGYRFIAAVNVRQIHAEEAPAAVGSEGHGGIDARPPTAPQAEGGVRASGERKSVTMLACRLTHWETLVDRLPPEAIYGLTERLFDHAHDTVERLGGTIRQESGGFLAIFGAPLALEDHVERALLSGVELRRRWTENGASPGPSSMALSMAVHSGELIVGSPAPGRPLNAASVAGSMEQLAELRQRADENAIVLSEATRARVQGSLDAAPLPPEDDRSDACRVIDYRPRHRLEGGGVRLTPFVGRSAELSVLLNRFELARRGRGQVVNLGGEPGIGKSRLLCELRGVLRARGVTTLRGRCVSYGGATPYLPLLDLLRELCGVVPEDAPERVLHKLEGALGHAGHVLAPLLGSAIEPDRSGPTSPQTVKAQTFAVLHELIVARSSQAPLVLEVEDLHWIDATSEEWLASLVTRLAGLAILLVVTFRTGYRPPWMNRSLATQWALAPLEATESRVVVENNLASALRSEARIDALLSHGEGNPFFLEELARASGDSGSESTPAVPDTVNGVLQARIDGLAPEARTILRTASVVGGEVPYRLLEGLTELPLGALRQGLSALLDSEYLVETGSRDQLEYGFRHALVQEAAYGSLLGTTRRALHARIGALLEEGDSDWARRNPERLADHFAQAELPERSLPYRMRAAYAALERSAGIEAVSHLEECVRLLAVLPHDHQHQRDAIRVYEALGHARTMARGYNDDEALEAYGRARHLASSVEVAARFLHPLWGLFCTAIARRQTRAALDLGKQLLAITEDAPDAQARLAGRVAMAMAHTHLGEPVAALRYCREAEALYDPARHGDLARRYGLDLGLVARMYAGGAELMSGFLERSRRSSAAALRSARSLGHAHTLALLLSCEAHFHVVRQDHPRALERAEELTALAVAQGFPHWVASGQVLAGLVRLHMGLASDASEVFGSLQAMPRSGAEVNTALLAKFCGACLARRETEVGLVAVGVASDRVEATGERHYEPEIVRLHGELLLQRDPRDEAPAEACFERALACARGRQMALWELRAASSLARLWQRQGRPTEAERVLEPALRRLCGQEPGPPAQKAESLRPAPPFPDLVENTALLASLRAG